MHKRSLFPIIGVFLSALLLFACSNDDSTESTAFTDETIVDEISDETVMDETSDETTTDVSTLCETVTTDGVCNTVTIASEKGEALERAYNVWLPTSPVEENPPLLVALHGLSNSIDFITGFTYARDLANAGGYVLAVPQGTTLVGFPLADMDSWNATVACCFSDAILAPNQPVPDDVAFMTRIIDDQIAENNIDPNRVYFMGHSNGGDMSYRMACEVSEKVTAIVIIAGVARRQLDQCKPENKVSVLHIHGTADLSESYIGGTNNRDIRVPTFYMPLTRPSVRATLNRWVALNGCDATPTPGDPFVFTSADAFDGLRDINSVEDLVQTAVEGFVVDRMATVEAYSGCGDGTAVQHVKVQDGTHVPLFHHDNFLQTVGNFLSTYGTRTVATVPDEADAAHELFFDASVSIVGLSGNSEVPPVDTDAYGDAILTNVSDTELRYEINVFNLAPSDVAAIHIHEGTEDVNGEVVVTLYDAASGELSFLEDSLFATATYEAGTLVEGRNYYVNLHTQTNPGGEIRGQIQFGNPPISLESTLSGENETTVVDSDASGTATLKLGGPQQWDWSVTTSSILAEEIIAIHIHRGQASEDGDVLLTLYPIPTGFPSVNNADGSVRIVTTDDDQATISGIVINGTRGFYEELIANPGNFYINAHTVAAPAGIIRGQLQRSE